MIPIPNYINKGLKNPKANFSLMFPRLVDWKNDDGKFETQKDEIVKNEITKETKRIDGAITILCKKYTTVKSAANDYLTAIHNHQSECVQVFGGKEIKAKLISPFITGLGAGHPTETGMILDRNTGVPYIPASSIKGVLKIAYAVNIANENGIADDNELDEIFGSQEQKGKIVILDAYPEKAPIIQNDIMNPHFGKYYNGENKLPLENENPVPIKFLSVQQGCIFVFRYLITDESVQSEDIEKAFDTAFSVVGFGGKTSIGYGKFERIESVNKKQEENETSGISILQDIDSVISSLKPIMNKQYEKGEAIVTEVKDGFITKVKARIKTKDKIEVVEMPSSKIKGELYEKIKIEIKDTNKNLSPKMVARV